MAATRRESEPRTIKACPSCDSPKLARRGDKAGRKRQRNPEHRYRCEMCGTTTNEPTEREPHNDVSVPRSGLARKLLEMDPDDVGGGA